ncbi:MAG: hypothetical protein JO317_02045, partial [Verrucomicrobiae bacterium]|nr:hypothetical protein [Verrucomicrobiae bacterium]
AQRYHPTDWRLHYLDGWALAPLTLRTDEARATFDKAILWSPAKSETARKAGLFFWPRRPEIAYDFWTRALELDPDPKRAYLAFLQKSGEIPGWPAFARVLAGNRPRRLVTLAQFLTDRQNSQGVPEVLAAAVAAAPRDVAVQEDLAIALLRHDQTAMAEQFLASIPLRTDRLRYARAECDRRLGRTDESLRVFHTLPSEHLPLASVSAGEIQLAAQKADAAPADFHLQTAYALLLVEGRRWAEADAQWERIHAQWPAYVEAFRYRAACLEQLGKTPEAAEQWSAYYRILLAVGY